jgi:hypothetical protein
LRGQTCAALAANDGARGRNRPAFVLLRTEFFFKRNVAPIEETPDRSAASSDLCLFHCRNDLIQCHIRLFFDQTQDKVLVLRRLAWVQYFLLRGIAAPK